jgi:hypothetical protein
MDRLLFLRWTRPPAVRTVPSGFRPVLTPDEARAAWERFRGLGAWDGPAVRLERLDDDGTLLLSLSSYRYWCLSHGLAGQEWGEAGAEFATAVRKIRATPPPRGWANTLGLMVFLRDLSGRVWGALRSGGVMDGAGEVAAAVSGGVEPRDLDSDDPLLSLARTPGRWHTSIPGLFVLAGRFVHVGKRRAVESGRKATAFRTSRSDRM